MRQTVRAKAFVALMTVAAFGSMLAAAPSADARIIDGELAIASDEGASVVGLVTSDGSVVCSGVVVASTWVLTAAHCLGAVEDGPATVRGVDGAVIEISGSVVHPAADPSRFVQSLDIGLVELATPTQWPVAELVDTRVERQLVADRAQVVQFGAGRGSSTDAELVPPDLPVEGDPLIVRTARMELTSHVACQAAYRGFDDSTHLCGLVDPELAERPCDGDSGGPVVADVSGSAVVVGLGSYTAPGCVAAAPVGWSRVAVARSWIAHHVGLGGAEADEGYALLGANGRTYAFGSASPTRASDLVFPTAIVADPDGHGHWTLQSWGALEPHDADELHARPCSPFVDESAPWPCTGWIAADVIASSDGLANAWVAHETGVVATTDPDDQLGDAGSLDLVAPIVDVVATDAGRGRYLLGRDGGVFAFGSAEFRGSLPGLLGPSSDVVAVALVPVDTGSGYWIIATDGGVFAFGDAAFLGSVPGALAPDDQLSAPIVAGAPLGPGYLLAGADGGVFVFGDAPFLGSLGASGVSTRIVDVVVTGGATFAQRDGEQAALASTPLRQFDAAVTDAVVGAAGARVQSAGGVTDRAALAVAAAEVVVVPAVDRTLVLDLVSANDLLDPTRLASEWIAANRSVFDQWVAELGVVS